MSDTYQKRREQGRCGACGAVPDKGQKLCRECRNRLRTTPEQNRRQYRRTVNSGLCRHCRKAKPVPGKSVCARCRTENTASAGKRRKDRRTKGLCNFCRKKALKGKTRCRTHLDQGRQHDRKNREKRIVRQRAKYWSNLVEARKKGREYKRKRQERNPLGVRHSNAVAQRRRRALRGSHTETQWRARVAYYGWRCRYCGKPLTVATLTKDHVIAVTKGGTDWASNLVPACVSCNVRKGNHPLISLALA